LRRIQITTVGRQKNKNTDVISVTLIDPLGNGQSGNFVPISSGHAGLTDPVSFVPFQKLYGFFLTDRLLVRYCFVFNWLWRLEKFMIDFKRYDVFV